MIKRLIGSILHSLDCAENGITGGAFPKYAKAQAYSFYLTEAALGDLEKGLTERVYAVAEHALSKDFLRFLFQKGVLDTYLDDEESSDNCVFEDEYEAMVTKDECAYLKCNHEVLLEVIKQRRRQYDTVINEMLERLENNYSDVCRKLLKQTYFTRIIGFDVDKGDIHNNGRSAMIIHTDAGKIVYKPHDVQIDAASAQMIRLFFSDITTAPAVCAYQEDRRRLLREQELPVHENEDGYGFVEFIQNTPADTEDDARAYFYNLGGLTAIFQMLGSMDMHHSNIISQGIYPTIIDYEMMLPTGKIYQDHSIAQDTQYSLLYSCLMPSRRGDIEMSILFARDEKNIGGPKVNGAYKSMPDYPDAFFKGFEEIYRRCLQQREDIKAFWKAKKDISIRFIYRSTSVYANLHQKIYESDWIEDADLDKELLKQLSLAAKRSGVSEISKPITEAETRQMLRGDIPYLYYKIDSCDLLSDGSCVCTDFFARSALDTLMDRLDHLSEEDLRFEMQLLQKAMTRVIRHKDGGYGRVLQSDAAQISDVQLREEAERIFLKIADDAVVTPSGQLCWFGTNYYLESGMNRLGSGLIEGNMGLQVFFAAVYRLSDRDEIKKRAKALIQHLTGRLQNWIRDLQPLTKIYPGKEDITFSSGLAGKILGCYLTGLYMEDPSYLALCAQMIELANKASIDCIGADVYSGLSGMLKVLCKYDALYALPGAAELCRTYADRLAKAANIVHKQGKLWRTLSPTWAISGAGHGQAGIGSAMYLAGKRLNRADYLEMAKTAFDFEQRIYNQTLGVWPDLRKEEQTEQYMTGYCSGAPGIGIQILGMNTEAFADMLENAIAAAMKEPLQYKDYLCCGNSAQVDFLLEAGEKLHRPQLVQAAREHMAKVIDRAEKNGYYCCTSKSLTEVFSPNLFYGTAGIGYELLRLLDPQNIQSVLI